MDFDDLELQILKNPARSLQLITAIENSEKKLISILLTSLAKFLAKHLGDACHAIADDGRKVDLFREDLLINATEVDEEAQEIIYSYDYSNFGFSIALHPKVTAWSLLEKRKLKGSSDIVISFDTCAPSDPDSAADLEEVIKEIDKILLPAAYKKRKPYGDIKYVLQRKIYISSETLLEDLVKGRMEIYFDPILSALSGFHRMPWDDLIVISEKVEEERRSEAGESDEL